MPARESRTVTHARSGRPAAAIVGLVAVAFAIVFTLGAGCSNSGTQAGAPEVRATLGLDAPARVDAVVAVDAVDAAVVDAGDAADAAVNDAGGAGDGSNAAPRAARTDCVDDPAVEATCRTKRGYFYGPESSFHCGGVQRTLDSWKRQDARVRRSPCRCLSLREELARKQACMRVPAAQGSRR